MLLSCDAGLVPCILFSSRIRKISCANTLTGDNKKPWKKLFYRNNNNTKIALGATKDWPCRKSK